MRILKIIAFALSLTAGQQAQQQTTPQLNTPVETPCVAPGEKIYPSNQRKLKPAQPLKNPPPNVSAEEVTGREKIGENEHLKGSAQLQIVIGSGGGVCDVRVLRATTDELGQKAAEAVRQWQFRPAELNHQPVAVQVLIAVNFTLTGSR